MSLSSGSPENAFWMGGLKSLPRLVGHLGAVEIHPVQRLPVGQYVQFIVCHVGATQVQFDQPGEFTQGFDARVGQFCGAQIQVRQRKATPQRLDAVVRDQGGIQDEALQRRVVDRFLTEKADVAAGVKQQLQADATRLAGLRLLPGRFMVIEQAMGVQAGRGAAAVQALAAFVEQAKSSGFVMQALARHQIQGALVAPAASR